MPLVWGRGRLTWRGRVSKALINSYSHGSDQNLDQDYKDPLNNKPWPPKAPAPPPEAEDIAWFIYKNLHKIIQPVLQVQTVEV